MEIATQPLTLYVDAAKKVLEQRLTDSNIKVSAIIDFADPMCVFRPDESSRIYHEAVGYFNVRREQRKKRKFLWDKVDITDLADIAVYRNGMLDVFVADASFNAEGENIARLFEELTSKQTKLYKK